jgi:hypothetical protein
VSTRKLMMAALLACTATTLGCSFAAREPNRYRADTRSLLETGNAALKTCYDSVITGNKGAVGNVTVNFTVQAETGRVTALKVDEANSSAPQPVQQCVLDAVGGVGTLDPPDANDGIATFSYEFEVAPQAAPQAKNSGFKAGG